MTQVEAISKNSLEVSGPSCIFSLNLWILFPETETQEQDISLALVLKGSPEFSIQVT